MTTDLSPSEVQEVVSDAMRELIAADFGDAEMLHFRIRLRKLGLGERAIEEWLLVLQQNRGSR